MNDTQQGHEESLTYHHTLYERGQHWFSAEYDGDEIAHAHVIERPGPGGPHAEIRKLWTNPHERGRGIGSRLLDQVSEHFKDQELRLKPYPIDEDGGQDEDELRRYYGNRGFRDYQLGEGDPFELYDYMTKGASTGSATELAGSPEVGPLSPGRLIRRSRSDLHADQTPAAGSTPVSAAGLAAVDFPAAPVTRGQGNLSSAGRELREAPATARPSAGAGPEPANDPAASRRTPRFLPRRRSVGDAVRRPAAPVAQDQPDQKLPGVPPRPGDRHELQPAHRSHLQRPLHRAAWAELIRSLTEEGFREPLKLEYEPDSRRAYLGEGNHRLVAAGLAGYTAVPVWGLRGYSSDRMRQARRVPGEPELKREQGTGYFPSSFRPSGVLPRSYLYLGENPQFCNRCTQEFPRGRAPEHLAEEHPAEWRQAWERYPILRGNYPHLAPGTTAAQHADPSPDLASWLSLPPGRDTGTALTPAVPRPPARQARPRRQR